MKALMISLNLIIAISTVMAAEWTTMKLDVSATLREQRGDVLEKLFDLPKGSVFRYKKVVGQMNYRTNDGSIQKIIKKLVSLYPD